MTMQSKHTILVVEDNPVTSKMVSVALAADGYQVIPAATGRDALDTLSATPVSLVLLDLLLPDADGVELLSWMRAMPNGERIPILAFSGLHSRMQEARALKAPFTDYVFKPVEPSRLTAIVGQHVGRSGHPQRFAQGELLLLVDDDTTQLKLNAIQLQQAGFEVFTASDAPSAFRAARARKPAIVLIDLVMPGMTGLELCYAIRQDPDLRDVPVIVASCTFSHIDDEDRRMARAMGANAFVLRTPALSEVIAAVKDHLGTTESPPVPLNSAAASREYVGRVIHQLERQASATQALIRRGAMDSVVLSVLMGAAEVLTRETGIAGVLREALARILDASGLSAGAIFLTDDADVLRPVAVIGGAGINANGLATFFNAGALLEELVRRESPTRLRTEAIAAAVDGPHLDLPAETWLVVAPIVASGRSLGALVTCSGDSGLTEDWAESSSMVAQQLGNAIALQAAVVSARESGQRLQAMFDELPVGLFRSSDDDTILDINPAAAAVLGYARSEMIGMPGAVLVSDADRARFHEELARDGIVRGFVARATRKNGSVCWVSVSAQIAVNAADGRRYVEGAFEDVTARIEAEQALSDSEARYRGLFASNPLPMWAYDARTLKFLAVNDAAVLHYGYSREEFLGMSLLDVRPPEDIPRLMQRLEQSPPHVHAVSDEKGWRHRKKDGTIIEVDVSRQNFVFGGRNAGIVSIRDVTAVRHAERLRRAEHGVAAALAESPGLEQAAGKVLESLGRELAWQVAQLWLVSDVDGRLWLSASWHADDFNQTRFLDASRQIGLARGEGLPGLAWKERRMIQLSDLDPTAQPRSQAAQIDGLVSAISFPLVWQGTVLGIIELLDRSSRAADGELTATLESIGAQIGQFHARNVAERSLVEARSRLDQTVSLSGTAFYTQSVQDDRVAYDWMTENVLQVVGYPAADMTYEVWRSRIHPDDLQAAMRGLERGVREGRAVQEYRFRDGDGAYRWIRDEIRAAGADGSARKLIGSLVDVTGLKNLEQQLFQSQKLESLGQLAGGVAHDFNNVLAAIMGCAEMALMELPAEHLAHKELEEVRAAAERGAALTKQLLAFSRSQTLAPKPLNANDVVQGMDRMLRRLMPKSIALSYQLDPDAPWIFADPGKLEQVLMNLVVNARDAMSGSGTITIGTEKMAARDWQDAEPDLLLLVSDTGCGMSDDIRERIFEPFFTTKAAGKGTGLGLSTVHGIVKQSGGNIEVVSAPGAGTSFRLRFPHVTEQQMHVAA